MREWSVYCMVATDGGGGLLDEEALDSFLDLLGDAGMHPVVSAGDGWYAFQVTVFKAEDAQAASTTAAHALRMYSQKAGLPDWPVVRLEVLSGNDLETELGRPQLPKLLGLAEVAETLGVSKQRVGELAREHPDFPKPILRLAATPVFLEAAVLSFLERWDRRPGRRRRRAA